MSKLVEIAECHASINSDGNWQWKKHDVLEAMRETGRMVETSLLEVINSDYIYDLLPGDGQDDYILGQITEAVRKRMKEILA